MKLVTKIITLTLSSVAFLSILFTSNSFALTYSSNVDVGFTFNPTISVNLSGDLLINNLAPGSTSDSNTINVTVTTNASQGYVLTATSGTKTTNTDLVNQTNSAYKFSSIATNADLANLTTDNTWGFSYSSDSGSTWSNYSGLPLDNDDEGATGKQLLSTINPSDNRTIQFKIGAKAATDQAAGTYLNTINFYAVANPDPTLQPVSCPAGKICYNANSLTPVEGARIQQSASNGASTNLVASNFKREGYGFAGWSDAVNGNGAKYGPNQTITAPDDISTNGYSLYAIWVKSAGDMQNWTGCSSLAQGEVTALKDSRDNDVYAVAKLADGKCWMIENLRLDDTPELSSTNTHNPSLPLTNVYDTGTTSNHLSPTSSVAYNATTAPEGWCTTNSSACDDQSRLRTDNTTYAQGGTYSYGNYYNWYSATAGHGKYGSNYDSSYTALGDICPTGWRLPTGRDITGDYEVLDIALGGTGSSQDTAEASQRWRSYPVNFVMSGFLSGSSISNRKSSGSYWSASGGSTSSDSNDAYGFSINSSSVSPGTSPTNKNNGRAIRCTAGT